MCVQLLYATQHRTVLIVFDLILQTTSIAQLVSECFRDVCRV